MSRSDPIADMLTQIRNALAVRAPMVEIPHSKLKSDLVRVLKKEGFVADFAAEGDGPKKVLRVFLRYTEDKTPAIIKIQRESKPGLRRYVASAKIPRIFGGMGVLVLSTSAGIMSSREAKKQGLGGEVLCSVW